ncbi:peptidoglycan-binding domain-containing protein [Streptomyces sp. NPDC046876]|uniref:peptidoglycan-binding domain-containing protein n=1 Tax=Streptomyces sp. NPDC046876 TaxID=3155616 RepID=UPI003404F0A5
MRTTRNTTPTALKGRTWRAAAAALVAAGVIAGVAPPAPPPCSRVHASPASANVSDSQPDLRPGMRGSTVTDLQRQLNSHGHHLKVDGIFGPETTAAHKAFHRAHG